MTYDFTLPAGTDPHRLAATISTFGIAHIPGHLSPAVAQTVAAQSRALLDATAPWVTQLEYSVGRSVRADSVGLAEVTEFAALSGVFTDPYLKSAADAFMAPTTYLFHHDLYVAYDVEGSHHFAHALHYDRVPHLKFFIYLTNVTAETGPLLCVPDSHHFAAEAQADNRRAGIVPTEEQTRIIPAEYQDRGMQILGTAGTLIAFTSDLVHSATHILAGERLVVRNRCIEPRHLEAVQRTAALTR